MIATDKERPRDIEAQIMIDWGTKKPQTRTDVRHGVCRKETDVRHGVQMQLRAWGKETNHSTE